MVTGGQSERRGYTIELKDKADEIFSDGSAGRPIDLPIVAFYDTDRVLFDLTERWSDFRKEFTRYDAFKGALASRTNFQGIFEWFYFKENEELREQRERRDFGYRLEDLSSLRHAISSMLGDVSEPHMEMDPPRFMVTFKTGGKSEKLALDQLSGGYRAVLALAVDLAWRMAQGNPHLDNPLESEAIVLVDEVDLHLHPSWQQRILDDLTRTFPHAQFIVSTHSPPVLTTVRPEHILELYREEGWTHRRRLSGLGDLWSGSGRRPLLGHGDEPASIRQRIRESPGRIHAARR